MINWQYYPKSDKIPDYLLNVVKVFEKKYEKIKSPQKTLNSNEVLVCLKKRSV